MSIRIQCHCGKTEKLSESSSVEKTKNKNYMYMRTTTPSFEFSVAEAQSDSVGLRLAEKDMKAYQRSETQWVNNCVFLQKNQTSLHLQTDNTRSRMGEGLLPFTHPHQQGRGLSRACSLEGCSGEDGERKRSEGELPGASQGWWVRAAWKSWER